MCVSVNSLEVEAKRIKEEIKKLYLNKYRGYHIPKGIQKKSLGMSGGKDSSLVLALTLEALMEIPQEERKETLYVLYSDTLMELLPVQAHTYKVLKNVEKFSAKHNLPIEVIHAKPTLENTMWSMMIAKGIRPPSTDNRWCTTRLKTDVQQQMLAEVFGTDDLETISIVGSRKEESVNRAKRLEKNTLDGHLKQHNVYKKSMVFAPIEDFTTEDVWITLRTSKIGREVLAAEELYALYASTGGEGEECQTILGNSNDNGLNPGCGKSGGRFGCWNCALQQGKDKALIGLSDRYPYIKHLIAFRDWNVSIRDGQWEKYRDVYNHKNFTRLIYNIDNHRFGMNGPGGMNLKTRREILEKLLYTESKINESVDFQLISDEELDFIQHCWILEGNFELTAMEIAEKYRRCIKVSDEDRELIAKATVLHRTQYCWQSRVIYWFNIYPDERFAIQFVKQINEKFGSDTSLKIIKKVLNFDEHIVADYLKEIQVKDQFYPSPDLEKMIRREWEQDQISFVTQDLIHDYEDTWGEARKIEDPVYDPNISMEDKYAILDNWRYYKDNDDIERIEHPEYMRHGGHTQYIKFRPRKISKEKQAEIKAQKILAKKPKTEVTQLTLAF